MEPIIISSKYEISIPLEVRKKIDLKPGDELQMFCFDDRMQLVELKPMQQMRGFIEKHDLIFVRDEEDRA